MNNETNDKFKNLKKALEFQKYELVLNNNNMTIALLIFKEDLTTVRINGINTEIGIEDIIDEIIYQKLDRFVPDGFIERKEFFAYQDKGYKFYMDDFGCFISNVTWVDVKGMSKAAQMELYDRFELSNYSIYEHHYNAINNKSESGLKESLIELANAKIVASSEGVLGDIKKTLTFLKLEYETYREGEYTVICIPANRDVDILNRYILNDFEENKAEPEFSGNENLEEENKRLREELETIKLHINKLLNLKE